MAHDRHVVAQGRRVIERRWRQVADVLIHLIEGLGEAQEAAGAAEGLATQGHLDALGAPRGAGGVEHVRPLRFVSNGRGGLGRYGVFPAAKALDGSVQHKAMNVQAPR